MQTEPHEQEPRGLTVDQSPFFEVLTKAVDEYMAEEIPNKDSAESKGKAWLLNKITAIGSGARSISVQKVAVKNPAESKNQKKRYNIGLNGLTGKSNNYDFVIGVHGPHYVTTNIDRGFLSSSETTLQKEIKEQNIEGQGRLSWYLFRRQETDKSWSTFIAISHDKIWLSDLDNIDKETHFQKGVADVQEWTRENPLPHRPSGHLLQNPFLKVLNAEVAKYIGDKANTSQKNYLGENSEVWKNAVSVQQVAVKNSELAGPLKVQERYDWKWNGDSNMYDLVIGFQSPHDVPTPLLSSAKSTGWVKTLEKEINKRNKEGSLSWYMFQRPPSVSDKNLQVIGSTFVAISHDKTGFNELYTKQIGFSMGVVPIFPKQSGSQTRPNNAEGKALEPSPSSPAPMAVDRMSFLQVLESEVAKYIGIGKTSDAENKCYFNDFGGKLEVWFLELTEMTMLGRDGRAASIQKMAVKNETVNDPKASEEFSEERYHDREYNKESKEYDLVFRFEGQQNSESFNSTLELLQRKADEQNKKTEGNISWYVFQKVETPAESVDEESRWIYIAMSRDKTGFAGLQGIPFGKGVAHVQDYVPAMPELAPLPHREARDAKPDSRPLPTLLGAQHSHVATTNSTKKNNLAVVETTPTAEPFVIPTALVDKKFVIPSALVDKKFPPQEIPEPAGESSAFPWLRQLFTY